MSTTEVADLKKRTQELLDRACRRKKFALKVGDHRTEDESIYLVVTPKKPGIHGSEYADILSDVERELGDEHILLVPVHA